MTITIYIVMLLSIAATAAIAYAIYLLDLLRSHRDTLHQLEKENAQLEKLNAEMKRACQEWAHDHAVLSTRLEERESKPQRRALRLAARHRYAKTQRTQTGNSKSGSMKFAKQWN